MKQQEELHFPRWVNKLKLLVGDTCYKKQGSVWIKHFYDGNKWIQSKIATAALKKISFRRNEYMRHVNSVRKTGI